MFVSTDGTLRLGLVPTARGMPWLTHAVTLQDTALGSLMRDAGERVLGDGSSELGLVLSGVDLDEGF